MTHRTWWIPAPSLQSLRQSPKPNKTNNVAVYERVHGEVSGWRAVTVSKELILAVAPEVFEERVFARKTVRPRMGLRRPVFRWDRPVMPLSARPTVPAAASVAAKASSPNCLPNPFPKAPLPDWVLF